MTIVAAIQPNRLVMANPCEKRLVRIRTASVASKLAPRVDTLVISQVLRSCPPACCRWSHRLRSSPATNGFTRRVAAVNTTTAKRNPDPKRTPGSTDATHKVMALKTSAMAILTAKLFMGTVNHRARQSGTVFPCEKPATSDRCEAGAGRLDTYRKNGS